MLSVPVEIGPQRQEITAVLERLARLDHLQYQALHDWAPTFYEVPAAEGLLVTYARDAVAAALDRAGRSNAHAALITHARKVVGGVAQSVAVELLPDGSPKLAKRPELAALVRGRLGSPVSSVLSALTARDLIDDSGFTRAHYDLLTGPWQHVLGQIHPEDTYLPKKPQPIETRTP